MNIGSGNSYSTNALRASGNSVLTHSIGKTDPRKTVLTAKEFCSRLTELRENGFISSTNNIKELF